MNVRATLAAILPFVAIGFIADSAMAKTIPVKSQQEVKKSCKDSGWGQLSQDRGKQHIWLHK